MIRLLPFIILLLAAPAWGQTLLAPGTYTVPPGTTITVPAPLPPPVMQYALTVLRAGTGAGTVTGAGTYPAGTQVTPQAVAAVGSTFDGWSLSIPITMDASKSVTGTFTLVPTPPPPPPPGSLDESHPIAVADGQGRYIIAKLRGSNYAGQAGTDLATGTMTAAGIITDTTVLVIPNAQEGHALIPGPPGIVLMVWQDLRNGVDYDVYGARVRTDGTVLDAGGFLIAGGARNQMSPSAAWDGTAWVVAYAGFDGTRYEIRSATVSAAGAVTAGAILATATGQHSLRPQVVATQAGPWLFWNEARSLNRIMARKLVPLGPAVQVTPTLLSIANTPTAVATDGRYVLLAWAISQEKAYSTRDVIGVIWDAAGGILVKPDATATTIFRQVGTGAVPGVLWIKEGTNYSSTSPPDGNVQAWSVMHDGTAFRAVWSTIHTQGGESWGAVLAHRISTRRIDPATGAYFGESAKEILSGSAALRNPILMGSGSPLRVLYETEAPDGRKIIQTGVAP